MSIAKPEPWTESAACHQYNPDDWFPGSGRNAPLALMVCSGCEVKTQCLEYALRMNEEHGVWGGLTEADRRRLRRKGAAA